MDQCRWPFEIIHDSNGILLEIHLYLFFVVLQLGFQHMLPFKSLVRGYSKIFVFEQILLCSPRLYLIDRKYSKNSNIVKFI